MAQQRVVAPIQRKRLADLAYDALRESILGGRVGMGERLIEAQLAKELNMSRAPLREALRRLSEEGLAVEHPHLGTSVATLTAQDLADLYNVRLALEPAALRAFMRRGQPVEPLAKLVERMHRGASRGNRLAVVQCEFDFHRHIASGSGNKLLSRIFDDLEGLLMLALHLDDAAFEDLHDIAAEHDPVVEAIASGDERHAIAVFEAHIASTVGEVLGRLSGDGDALLIPLPSS